MSRVAVLAPHPDDEVLGCTSVLLEHDVIVVHVTEGVPASVVGDEAVALRAARERESRAACAELGVEVERFLTLDALDQEVWCRTSEVASASSPSCSPRSSATRCTCRRSRAVTPITTASTSPRSLRGAHSTSRRFAGTVMRSMRSTSAGTPATAGSIPGLFPDVTDRPVLGRRDRTEVTRAAGIHHAGPRGIRRPELARRTGERAVRADAAARRTAFRTSVRTTTRCSASTSRASTGAPSTACSRDALSAS